MPTIFIVHLPDLPGVLPFLDHIVIELIPEACGGELRARNTGEGIKIHAVYIQPNDIEEEGDEQQLEQCP